MSFISKISALFKGKPDVTIKIERPTVITDIKHSTTLCKCVHCHKEFEKEDFIGICTSRDCDHAEIVLQDINTMQYYQDRGHRRLLLRKETADVIHSLKEDASKVTDIVTSNRKCTCGSAIYFYACPFCRRPMPFITAGDMENVIAPAGIKASGKTSYMTVLIDFLTNNPIHNCKFELTTQFTDADDYKSYIENRHNIIFKGRDLPMNNPNEVPKPYIIRSTAKNIETKTTSSIHTLWYDFAGEALTGAGAHDPILQYYRAMKGMMLFIDPKNIKRTVEELHLNTYDDPNPQTDGLVITTINQILNSNNGEYNALKEKYIAVILNKVDLFRGNQYCNFFNEDSIVWQPSPHKSLGAFSLEDYHQVSHEVERYISMYHPLIYGLLRSFMNDKGDNIGYFAVSALGQESQNGELLNKISPIRIEDPFYWMLWKMNCLPVIGEKERDDSFTDFQMSESQVDVNEDFL